LTGSPIVSRETLEALAGRYGLGTSTAEPLRALLVALAGEADPPTTLRSPKEALDGHIADSLSGLEVPELAGAGRIADIGAGAGFPGLALAAALPDARVDLIESSARKAAVIERLAAAAGLTRATALHVRAEDWAGAAGAAAYDAVTARALAPLAVLAEYAAPLLRQGGALVAWKGSRNPAEEAAGSVAGARLGLRPEKVLQVRPFEGARDRYLHVYLKVRPTPPGFPRRAGVARKRPLA
jgi:16S rRNA (guanine527-N7)-methyltransferase